MSLIVCSNETLGDKNYDRYASNQAPYRFTNHLVSPLEIPPDSEVAVHSVKCNKDGLVKLNPSLNWYQFFNVNLRTDTSTPRINSVDTSTGWEIKCFPELKTSKRDEYVSLYDFADRMEKGMREGFPHPDATSKSNPLTTMDILRDSGTTGAGFKGFRMKYKYHPANASGTIDNSFPDSFNRLFENDGVNRIEYNNSTHKIKALVGKGAGAYDHAESQKNCMFAAHKPLSHLGGILEYDLREMGTKQTDEEGNYSHTSFNKDFIIGLNRGMPVRSNGLNMNIQLGFGSQGDFSNYQNNPFDYAVSCEQIGEGGNRWLKVGHLGKDPSDADEDYPLTMNDIQYYKGQAPLEWADSNFNTAGAPTNAPEDIGRYQMSSNASHFDTIEFKLNNEIMTISFLRKYSQNGSGGNGSEAGYPTRLEITSFNMKTTNPTGIHKNCYPKPAGQTCWNLYPKVMLPFKNQEVHIVNYGGRDTGYNAGDPVGCWYSRMLIQGEMEGILNVDQRYYNDPSIITEYSQKGTSGAGTSLHLDHYIMNVILAPQTLNYPHTTGANAQYVLGFIARGVLDTDNGVRSDTDQEIYYDSDSTPSIQAKDSMFIRLDNFTQKSFNAGTGRPSKIIHHLPRFDTSNREIGAGLYFEPNSMTYIKLNNANPIVVNELDFSICNSREQLITDLTGETIICLHFRKSAKM